MLENLGNFAKFFWDILGFVWKSFFEDAGQFFTQVAEAPAESPFEVLFVLFFIGAAATVVVGAGWSLVKLSPLPFIRTVEAFNRLFGQIGAWIIVVLIVAMVYEVIARYFFDAPTQWAFEMAYMLMGTSFMFGIAYCLQMGRHIRVDFVYDHVSVKKQAAIDLVGYLLLLPMVLWLMAGLYDYFQEAYRVDEESGESAWNPIIWPFKFTFVIGFVLLFFQVVVESVKAIMVLSGHRAPSPPPMEGLS